MRLRKPIPLDKEVRVLARITEDGKRFFKGYGEIILEDGVVAVEGKGRYLRMDINKIADFDVDEQQWRVVNIPEDPKVVRIISIPLPSCSYQLGYGFGSRAAGHVVDGICWGLLL